MLLNDLMKKWWNATDKFVEPELLSAENENGEMVVVTMTKDYFKTETVQNNNWVRENRWYRDGSSTETYTR